MSYKHSVRHKKGTAHDRADRAARIQMIKERRALLLRTTALPMASNGVEALNEIMQPPTTVVTDTVARVRTNPVVEINGVKVSYKGAKICKILRELGPDVNYPEAKRVMVERGIAECSDTAFTKYMKALWGKDWKSIYVRTNGTKSPRQHPWKLRYPDKHASSHIVEKGVTGLSVFSATHHDGSCQAVTTSSVTNFGGPGFEESVNASLKACYELWKGSLSSAIQSLKTLLAKLEALEQRNGRK